MPKASALISMPLDKESFGQLCINCLNKVPNSTLSKEGDTFILKEKTNLTKGTYGVKAEIKYDANTVTIKSKCGGIGPVQSNHVQEVTEIIKGLLERGVQNPTQNDSPNEVICPKCGGNQIEIVKRGWSLATGFIGSGKNERVCKNCMYIF